ncbi:hypothetical protein FRB94_012653 [Tulasnella sp. JGI-2019a]|nr:hypothetical protein FRB93_001523 [Tulasnella sp. JGI-2019a]KAG9009016.1 hypothetical protein FRB94_012653 [Tulasnella sp. JGI-2019a]KAG9036007.1 hypothetical protein FRB95_010007 [Tulasnella sp. JGI-2019a]
MSSTKERHYQQLASKLQVLSKELEKTHRHFGNLAEYLHSMNNLGAVHAAQFMAVSRILDAEMTRVEEERDAASPPP